MQGAAEKGGQGSCEEPSDALRGSERSSQWNEDLVRDWRCGKSTVEGGSNRAETRLNGVKALNSESTFNTCVSTSSSCPVMKTLCIFTCSGIAFPKMFLIYWNITQPLFISLENATGLTNLLIATYFAFTVSGVTHKCYQHTQNFAQVL